MKFLKIIFPVFLVGIIVGAFFGLPRILKINTIICSNQYGPCSDILVENINPSTGLTLFQVRKELANLLDDHRLVSDYLIQYKIGGIVTLDVIEKVARGAIKLEGTSQYFLVDSQGEVVAQKETTTLPYIEIPFTPLALSDTISSRHLGAIGLINDLSRVYGVSYGIVKGDSLYVNIDSIEGIFPLNKSKDVLLGSFKLILDQLNAEAKDPKISIEGKITTIDLRFDNPVLR